MLKQFTDDKDSVVLAWTNNRVKDLNNTIRKHLFGDKVSESSDSSDSDSDSEDSKLDPYYPGEKLLFSGYRRTSKRIYNSGDLITIKEVSIDKRKVPHPYCKHCEPSDDGKIKGCKACGVPKHATKDTVIPFHVLIDEWGTEWLKVVGGYGDRLSRLLTSHKKMHAILRDPEGWRKYYDLKVKFDPDLMYSYALTVHKAQGSEWDYCGVDIGNIRFNRNTHECTRLSYTAVSRFRKLCYFI